MTIRSRGASRTAWSGRLLVADERVRATAFTYGFTPLATTAGAEPDTVTVSMPPESWAALTTTT
ncbi:hypothetical protein ACTMTJ_38790 [Phytohabitans sp. LJ34]|uniref:hypothetical protein n=1 Tax=Phytohabitans sp. LJ34 TaxID=3452217 RepID=UPI003F89DD6B